MAEIRGWRASVGQRRRKEAMAVVAGVWERRARWLLLKAKWPEHAVSIGC